ncbi:MAG: aspartate/glutamate racemase family protein [Sphingorhabdus sp.]
MSGRTLSGGRSIEGYAIGVLHLASTYPLPPGNAQHAQTFRFPVAYQTVPISDPWMLMNGDPAIAPLMIEACAALIKRGVRVIVGACGSFAYFQQEVAAASEVPVFTSVLAQIPFLLQALGRKKLGVICASASSINERIYEQCRIDDPSRLAITQMKGMSEFDAMLTGVQPMDVATMEKQAVEVATKLQRDTPDIGAIMLQCSDLPPYGRAIQEATGLPVYDAVTLINWAAMGADYPGYTGMMRYC